MAPLLVMTLLYTQIFWSLQGRLKESCPHTQASLLREKKLACSLALVLILFAGCWIPLHLMNCLLLFHGPQAVSQGTLYTGKGHMLFIYLRQSAIAVFSFQRSFKYDLLTGKTFFSRYSPVSCQLCSQPCGLRLSHPKDPTGLPSNMEALDQEAELLPWGQASLPINSRPPMPQRRVDQTKSNSHLKSGVCCQSSCEASIHSHKKIWQSLQPTSC